MGFLLLLVPVLMYGIWRLQLRAKGEEWKPKRGHVQPKVTATEEDFYGRRLTNRERWRNRVLLVLVAVFYLGGFLLFESWRD